jgi:hypothetical protein
VFFAAPERQRPVDQFSALIMAEASMAPSTAAAIMEIIMVFLSFAAVSPGFYPPGIFLYAAGAEDGSKIFLFFPERGETGWR